MTVGSKLNGYGYENKWFALFIYVLWGGIVSLTPNLEDQGIPFGLGHHL